MACPTVSRWASVRLPLTRRFRKPPYDPGRRDFPSPVLTLAFLRGPSQIRGEAQALTYIHPAHAGLPTSSSLASKAALPRHSVRGPPWDRQVPRAPLLHAGVTVMQETSGVSSQDITPTSSLLRAHAPNRCPPAAFDKVSAARSLQVAVSPCCATVLPDVISADLSLRVWTPTPAAPRVHVPVSSPGTMAFPAVRTGSAQCTSPTATSVGSGFRSCSHSLMFRPTRLLATPVAPTLASCDAGRPWLLRPRVSRFVTSPCSGYAHRPNPGN